MDYPTYRWLYIDKLLDCLAIKLSLAIGWFFCWIFSIKKKRVIAFKGNIRQKLVLLLGCVLMCWLLSYISTASKAYIYERTEGGYILSMGAVFWIYMLMYFLLPLLLMAAWSISVEHYVYLELDALGDRKNKRFKLQVYSGVLGMIAYGIMLLYFIVIGGEFLTEHWLYIDELSKWVGILAGMTLLCIIGLICIITQRRKINTIARSIVVMVVTISIVLTLGVSTNIYMEYAEEEAFWIRLHKSVEFTEEYGPYVENPYFH